MAQARPAFGANRLLPSRADAASGAAESHDRRTSAMDAARSPGSQRSLSLADESPHKKRSGLGAGAFGRSLRSTQIGRSVDAAASETAGSATLAAVDPLPPLTVPSDPPTAVPTTEAFSASALREATGACWSRRLTHTIAGYEKLEQVGEGTYGVVFRCRDRRDGRTYALKKVRVHGNTYGLPITALREIKILRHMRHGNMVALKEIVTGQFGEDEGETVVETKVRRGRKRSSVSREAPPPDPDEVKLLQRIGSVYLVMEYVEHDFAGLLDSGFRFSPVQIKAVMRQLLGVLAFLHEKRVVHRDIKCSNLLIGADWQLKLADFGLARSLELPEGRQLTNKVITLWYRPPELLLGSRAYGASVDIWSVGCIFAELLLGKVLFQGKEEKEQISLIFKVLGTPTADIWPAALNLPHAAAAMSGRVVPSVLRRKYGLKMSRFEGAIDLVERLLQLDPDARTPADVACNQSYFVMHPLPPANLRDLGTLPEQGLHEYQTKMKRKAEKKAQHLAKAGAKARSRRGKGDAQTRPRSTRSAHDDEADSPGALEAPGASTLVDDDEGSELLGPAGTSTDTASARESG